VFIHHLRDGVIDAFSRVAWETPSHTAVPVPSSSAVYAESSRIIFPSDFKVLHDSVGMSSRKLWDRTWSAHKFINSRYPFVTLALLFTSWLVSPGTINCMFAYYYIDIFRDI
jgi:hypothetical protein